MNVYGYSRSFWLLFGLIAAFLYLLVTLSPASQSNSDPELTLVVSQAMLEEGTIYLDAYQNRLALSQNFAGYQASGMILEQNGHYLNYFPVGSSLLALPVVAAAHLLGYDMTRYADNDAVQNVLSGLTVIIVWGLLVFLARHYLNNWLSLGIALFFVLGTSIISTLGTAYWTHNLSLPIFLWVLLLIIRREVGQTPTLHPFLLGGLICVAYICRASAAAFILPFFLYLVLRLEPATLLHQPLKQFFTRNQPFLDLLKVAGAAAVGLGLYVLVWHRLTGQWFPAYASVTRFQAERAQPLTALAGLFISPGRGLFVYSPFLLLVLLLTLRFLPQLKPYRLLLFMGFWLAFHLFIIVRAASWWGGASYGPRLLVDVLPAWFFLLVWGWQMGQTYLRPRTQHLLLLLTLPLLVWSVYLHSYQGLFNRYLDQWEIEMAPEPGQTELFNWTYPPFRASAALFCQRDAVLLAQGQENAAASLGTYQWGQELRPQQALNLALSPLPVLPTPISPLLNHTLYLPLLHQPTGLILTGWSPPAYGFSWSKCPQATLYFRLGDVTPESTYRLIWQGATLGEQEITVRLNETVLETFTAQIPTAQPAERIWLIPGSVLHSHQLNSLTFDLPNARPADELDNRLLALAFFVLRLEVAEATRPQTTPSPYP